MHKLLGILEKQDTTQQAIKCLQGILTKRKIFLKCDTIKFDKDNNFICYVYLNNKTFVNNHLARTGFVAIDTSIDYKYKKKFWRVHAMAKEWILNSATNRSN